MRPLLELEGESGRRQLLEEQRRTNQLLSGAGQSMVPEFKDPQAGMFGRKG